MIELERLLTEALVQDEPLVPPSPPLASAIASLDRGADDLRLDHLGQLAIADAAVAIELLAGARHAPALPDAAARAGDAALLELARAAAGRAPAAGPLRPLRDRAWRLSVVSALLCRELAGARGLPEGEAYAAGLLHGAGTLVALSAFERLAAGARPARAVALSTWQRLAERWAAPLGLALAERRRLPAPIAEAMASRQPAPGAGVAPPLVRLVRTVDAVVAVLSGGRDPGEAVALADLSDAEASLLARALPAAEAYVARLERLAPRRSPRARVADAPARERNGRGPRLWLAGREYAAVGFAPHQLLVTGPAPLGEGALLQVEVLDGRSAFHARVLTAWAEGDRFGAILVPFGLSGPALADFGGVIPAGGAA
jgi:HD-like signal output (HDOD) protein